MDMVPVIDQPPSFPHSLIPSPHSRGFSTFTRCGKSRRVARHQAGAWARLRFMIPATVFLLDPTSRPMRR
jgi:hypothetical protein